MVIGYRCETMVSKQLIPSNSGANRGPRCGLFPSSCGMSCCCGFPSAAAAAAPLWLLLGTSQAQIHSRAFPFSRDKSGVELKIDMAKKKSIVEYPPRQLVREREREDAAWNSDMDNMDLGHSHHMTISGFNMLDLISLWGSTTPPLL
uniref:Putative GDP-D-mannose pyrophosphorylase n=1 Tax=Amorphophallus konjac TaxID=78372 RepID=F8U880_AMOKO|nr:putative GDP-D-mannose pyrophosphorylase [Amorphophallus konjac]